MMRRGPSVVVLLAALLVAAPLRAQEPTPPQASLADDLPEAARADYLAGRALFGDGDFAGALVRFQNALETTKDSRLYWNIGVCHRSLRHYSDAIRALERFMADSGARVTDAQRADAAEFIAGLRPYVAALSVRSSERAASVLVDDKIAGTSPLDRYLVDLGAHTIVLRKAGFADQTRRIDVTETKDVSLDVTMPHEGRLIVHAGAGDAIALDGKTIGSTTFDGSITSGRHHLRVSAEGKRTREIDFNLDDGQVRTLDVALEKGGLPTWAWIGAGAAVATGIVIAGVLLFRPEDTKTEPVVGTMDPFLQRLDFRPR